MADDVVVFTKSDLPLQAFPLIEDIRRRGKLCDVTLRIGESKFSAHRIVLAASIPYFHAMFTHDLVESKQDEITVQGIEASALESLINFAYNGRVQIDTTNVQLLLVGSSFLHLQVVKDACCDFMQNRLHPNNVVGVRSFGDQFMCSSLMESCDKFIQKNFVDVSNSDEFLMLSKKELIEILSWDELHVKSEEQVFEAAVRWIRKDLKNRANDMEDLMKQCRLPLLMPQFLADRVAQEELVRSSLRCRDLLDEAKDYHLIPERRSQLKTFKTRPRCCPDFIGVIYAVGGLTSLGDSVSTVEYYDSISGRWQIATPMSTLRSRVGISVLNGRLYAVGGYDGQERLNTVEVFDPVNKIWRVVAPMLCKRSALGAVSMNNKLFVCGGYDGVTSLSSVEMYDESTDQWTMVSSMEKHRSASGVVVLNDHIYAIGGHDGLSIFDSVEMYSFVTGQWTIVTPMLSKRCRLGVASLHGRVYVAGGYDGNVFLRTVECYDPVTDRWSRVASMNIKRSRVALATSGGKLYAIGGYDGTSNLSSVECYSPEVDQWTFVSSMCAHEGGVGVGVIAIDSG